jgi:hypothetical protein
MAENKQMGPAINKAIIVTSKELYIKGKKPNKPDNGFQSVQKSILIKE